MTSPASPVDELIALSHRLGIESRGLAMLGEGNASALISDHTFVVKASGASLGTLDASGVVECDANPIRDLLAQAESPSDEAVDQFLLDVRVNPAARKPSVETLFHAYLLGLPGVSFVAHTHPIHVCGILCSPHAEQFASTRLFPDQIVCCGATSVLVPYTDPGLALSRAIRDAVEEFVANEGSAPRTILLQNHGAITLGPTANAAEAGMLMLEKSARIFLAAAACGPVQTLEPEQVSRIEGRPDEKHRRQALGLEKAG